MTIEELQAEKERLEMIIQNAGIRVEYALTDYDNQPNKNEIYELLLDDLRKINDVLKGKQVNDGARC